MSHLVSEKDFNCEKLLISRHPYFTHMLNNYFWSMRRVYGINQNRYCSIQPPVCRQFMWFVLNARKIFILFCFAVFCIFKWDASKIDRKKFRIFICYSNSNSIWFRYIVCTAYYVLNTRFVYLEQLTDIKLKRNLYSMNRLKICFFFLYSNNTEQHTMNEMYQ